MVDSKENFSIFVNKFFLIELSFSSGFKVCPSFPGVAYGGDRCVS